MAIYTNSTYRANGKLLLSAEYFVLDGALALALPTRLGQELHLLDAPKERESLHWKSQRIDGSTWFEGQFDLNTLQSTSSSNPDIASRLEEIFAAIAQLKPGFFSPGRSFDLTTQLEFPRAWGLGTSSTLITTLAQWANVDPYVLLEKTFGGSGYDIACAKATGPISYQRVNGQAVAKTVAFNPPFQNQLYFVYLGQKQNSREGIAHYRQNKADKTDKIKEISTITQQLLTTQTLEDFATLIDHHENIVSNFIQVDPVKEKRFADFWGSVKSLGAWGGDFVLLTSDRSAKETQAYCNERGFEVFIPYKDLIL